MSGDQGQRSPEEKHPFPDGNGERSHPHFERPISPSAHHLRWGTRPDLKDPILVAAFEGWNDAGEAATTAASVFQERWDASIFADIDPEDFYDFTATRPRIEIEGQTVRQIVWPANEFAVARIPRLDRDIVLFRGVEPHLKWRTYCEQFLALIDLLDIDLFISLGALLAEVPHSRPVSVFGTAYDHAVVEALDLAESTYEGPTGIVGTLHATFQQAGIKSASLWAAVPTYVPGAPSPKAALALIERTTALVGGTVDTSELEVAAKSYEEQVTELVEEDDETLEYVQLLERRYDDGEREFGSATLVQEVERFLRGQSS